MALNFPNSPTENQVFGPNTVPASTNGVTYQYIEGAWRATSTYLDFDDVYVNEIGDNMTGPLTIGPDGGSAVTTLADDGSATFAGLTEHGQLQVGGDARLGNSQGSYTVAGSLSLSRNSSSGDLFMGYLTGNTTPVARIGADGSASFAGDVLINNPASSARLDITSTTAGSNSFVKFSTAGNFGYIGIDETNNVLKVNGTNGLTTVSNLAITPSGQVSIGSDSPTNDFYVHGQSDFNGTIKVGNAAAITSNQRISLSAATGTLYVGLNEADSNNSKIKLNGTDGSATFAGNVKTGENSGTWNDNLNGALLTPVGSVVAYRNNTAGDDDTFAVFNRYDVDTTERVRFIVHTDGTVKINAKGTAKATASKIRLNPDGSAVFKGTVQTAGGVVTPSAIIQTETEDPANYTTTTSTEIDPETGEEITFETQVYNGPTLDVKDRLTKADTALQTLKTAAAAAADFAALKAAIATALADI